MSAYSDGLIEQLTGAGGLILGVSDNRGWIEFFYEGDLMHTKRIDLPTDTLYDIVVEEIAHKATLFQYSHTLVYFDGPCDVEIRREGNRIIVRGCQPRQT